MKNKPGKYLKNAQAFKHFVRPKAKEEDILSYLENENYLNADGPTPKKDNPYYQRHLAAEAHATDRIQDQDRNKKAKKNRVVDSSLSKPHTLPKNYELWLDKIDPQWWILPEDPTPDPKEEAALRLKKLNFEKILRERAKSKIASGLEALMHLNRGQV